MGRVAGASVPGTGGPRGKERAEVRPGRPRCQVTAGLRPAVRPGLRGLLRRRGPGALSEHGGSSQQHDCAKGPVGSQQPRRGGLQQCVVV